MLSPSHIHIISHFSQTYVSLSHICRDVQPEWLGDWCSLYHTQQNSHIFSTSHILGTWTWTWNSYDQLKTTKEIKHIISTQFLQLVDMYIAIYVNLLTTQPHINISSAPGCHHTATNWPAWWLPRMICPGPKFHPGYIGAQRALHIYASLIVPSVILHKLYLTLNC